MTFLVHWFSQEAAPVSRVRLYTRLRVVGAACAAPTPLDNRSIGGTLCLKPCEVAAGVRMLWRVQKNKIFPLLWLTLNHLTVSAKPRRYQNCVFMHLQEW